MAFVHSKKIIHRDIHNGNRLLKLDGSRHQGGVSPCPTLWLTDFGMACLAKFGSSGQEARPARDVLVVGGYNAAPELLLVRPGVAEGSYTTAIDVWAFACVALEAGCQGEPPFYSTKGRRGIIDKVLQTIGNPPEDLVKLHRSGKI